MPIWRLEPCDLNDPNWEASTHRGTAIVRAPSEAAARETAEKAFGVKTRFAPGKGLHLAPWLRPQLVDAKIIENTIYAEEGPDEVLEPSFLRDLPHRERRRTKAPASRGKITPT
jgi:type II secretory pathway component HofQ